MEDLGTEKVLMVGLTEQWEAALDARLAMYPRYPVRVLDEFLRARLALATSRAGVGAGG